MARPESRRAVTAAASIVNLSEPIVVQMQKAARRPWQDVGWSYYRSMPEVRYPANWKGNALSRFVLRVGVRDPDDRTAPATIPEIGDRRRSDLVRAAEEIVASLEGPQGGGPEILKRYSINMDVAADGWLIGTDQTPEIIDWEFVSIRELVFAEHEGRMQAYRDPVGDGDVDTSNPALRATPNYSRRFWISHPERSQQADGALEALRDDCERLKALNESITARIVSRLATAGLLFIPNSVTLPIKPENASEQAQLAEDPFIRQLIAYFEATLTNRGTAAGSLPILLRGPDDMGEKIKHITLDRTIDKTEMALRAELRETIVRGQDLPDEVQTGLGDASHWSAWSVMDSAVQNHLQPAANRFADGLTRVYLHPAIDKMFPDLSLAERRSVVVVADGSGAVSKPNAAEDGRQLHDRAVISDAALRERGGAIEAETPSEDEYVRILGRQAKDPYLATFGLEVANRIDWDKVGKGNAEGAPGVGGTPPSRRPADSSDPVGNPGDRAKRDAKK